MALGLPEEVRNILNKPLTTHKRKGPGGSYSYHKGSDVIRRLNQAFGHSWSSERVEASIIEDQVLLLVNLTVYTEGDTIIHHGYGSAPIARRTSDNKVIDIGNAYKSAFTNALKKAAEQFGIGLGEEEDDDASVEDGGPPTSGGSSGPPPRAAQSAPASFSRPSMARPAPLPPRTQIRANGVQPRTQNASGNGMHVIPQAAITPSQTISAPELGNHQLTSTQEKALANLAKMKKIGEEQLIKGALGEQGKSAFKELTRDDAVKVIKHANTLPVK